MGFKRASEIAAMIRSWHFGRFPAMRSARARERLTEIMPALLTALGETGDADHAFIAFDRFLAGLPTGVQLFSLLRSNPKLLDLIATILGSAPRLAGELSATARRCSTRCSIRVSSVRCRKPPKSRSSSRRPMPDETPLDEVIDRVRVVAKEQAFRIGVRILVRNGERGRSRRRASPILPRSCSRGCTRRCRKT